MRTKADIVVLVLGIVLALAFLITRAQVFSDDNTLSTVAPIENTDGSPLSDLAEIRFYHQVNADSSSSYDLVHVEPVTQPGAQITWVHAAQGDGVHCYVATAVDSAGLESERSNRACKTIDTLFPGSPSSLTVE